LGFRLSLARRGPAHRRQHRQAAEEANAQNRYMSLAHATGGKQKGRGPPFENLKGF
jgi:hypothetical protein